MAEHKKEEATVVSLDAAVPGRLDEALYFEGGEVLVLAVVEQRVVGVRHRPLRARPVFLAFLGALASVGLGTLAGDGPFLLLHIWCRFRAEYDMPAVELPHRVHVQT